jgi:hypothetical protein
VDSVADLNRSLDAIYEMQAKLGSKQVHRKIDWTMEIGRRDDTFHLPYWLLVLMSGVPAIALGVRRPYRLNFSLRTMLIATALVAVVLGLSIYVTR